jgi:hypothetical protein
MDVLRVANGLCAVAALVMWTETTRIIDAFRLAAGYEPSRGVKVGQTVTFVSLLWYSLVNMTTGFGFWELSNGDAVPYFRWAFWAVTLAPAWWALSAMKQAEGAHSE